MRATRAPSWKKLRSAAVYEGCPWIAWTAKFPTDKPKNTPAAVFTKSFVTLKLA